MTVEPGGERSKWSRSRGVARGSAKLSGSAVRRTYRAARPVDRARGGVKWSMKHKTAAGVIAGGLAATGLVLSNRDSTNAPETTMPAAATAPAPTFAEGSFEEARDKAMRETSDRLGRSGDYLPSCVMYPEAPGVSRRLVRLPRLVEVEHAGQTVEVLAFASETTDQKVLEQTRYQPQNTDRFAAYPGPIYGQGGYTVIQREELTMGGIDPERAATLESFSPFPVQFIGSEGGQYAFAVHGLVAGREVVLPAMTSKVLMEADIAANPGLPQQTCNDLKY